MGGRVFFGSEPIELANIKPTIERYKDELCRVFPNFKPYSDKLFTLGSVGKKPVSGDIDLGISDNLLWDFSIWEIDKATVNATFNKFKSRARSASDIQLLKRAVVDTISDILSSKSNLIKIDKKSTGAGIIFGQFPQFDSEGKMLDKEVQIDLNFGHPEWLTTSYHSSSEETTPNIKGLHRTQLLVALLSNLGYTFNHNYGVKSKTTNRIVANDKSSLIRLINSHGIKIAEFDLDRYTTLKRVVDTLDEPLHSAVIDSYLRILDSTRAEIPSDLIDYWVENRDRLNLTGKFLPDSSPLKKFI